MTFFETQQPGYNPKLVIDNKITEPLAVLFPSKIKSVEIEYQEKGSSGNAYRLSVLDAQDQRHELLLKRENNFDYVGFYNDYLKPYELNSPRVYGYLQQGSDNLLVADYIPHEKPDWTDPGRYRQALQWLIRKDKVSGDNLERVRQLPNLGKMNWYGTTDWYDEIEQGYKNSVHPLLTQELWNLFRDNGDRLEEYIAELKTEGPQTVVHGDLNMNNILFGAGEQRGQLFVIDWTQPHVSSVLHDLVHLVDGAPQKIKDELIHTYRSELDFYNFDKLYKKADTLWDVHYFAWMAMMMNEKQGSAIHQADFQRIKVKLETSLMN